jgi:anti-sigma regulatory factor (Ser/Thr protein kinase)
MIAEQVRVHGLEQLGDTLAALVERLAELTGLPYGKAYRLRLAAEEIVTNVVMHGYGGHGGPIDIDTGYDEAWVWLRVEDEAPDFDPAEHDPTPRLSMDPVMAPLGGFGLFLALSSVDEVTHEYVRGRNRTMLRVRRGAGDEGGTDGEAARAGGH